MAKNRNTLVFEWFWSSKSGEAIIHYKWGFFSLFFKDWFQFSKGLKDNFKPDYNERACPVREYNYVSQSDVVSSDGSTCSVTTDQTDCSIEHDPEDLSAPFPSNPVSSEEVQKASV